jgi:hypothetical protein
MHIPRAALAAGFGSPHCFEGLRRNLIYVANIALLYLVVLSGRRAILAALFPSDLIDTALFHAGTLL